MEFHLSERERELFHLNRTIILYDLTNSYFEGQAAGNPKARRSANSKEKRSDCPIVSVGLVLDGEGFILTHKVFPGSLHDSKSMVEALRDLHDPCDEGQAPIVVPDALQKKTANCTLKKERKHLTAISVKSPLIMSGPQSSIISLTTRKRAFSPGTVMNRITRPMPNCTAVITCAAADPIWPMTKSGGFISRRHAWNPPSG